MIPTTFLQFALLSSVTWGASSVTAISGGSQGTANSSSGEAQTAKPSAIAPRDWSSIRAAYESSRHAAFASENSLQSRNFAQRWNTQFDGAGFQVKPDVGDWSWGLELRSYGTEKNRKTLAAARSMFTEGAQVGYQWDAFVTEWYKNETRGMEHGLTLHARPQVGDGNLMFAFAVRGELSPRVESDGLNVRFVDNSSVSVVNYSGLVVTDATGRVLPSRFESSGQELRLYLNDSNAHYPITIDPIAQQAYLKASNTGNDDTFGFSVAVSGNTVVIGAPSEDSKSTGVNGDQSDNSSLSAGAAYVFVRNGSTWTQEAYLKASNTEFGMGLMTPDNFGRAVAISGDTIVVGAPFEDSGATGVNGNQNNNAIPDSGAVYVFVRNGGTWTQQAYLKAHNPGVNDQFGSSLAISGDTVIVGASFEDSSSTGINGPNNDSTPDSGAAYIFARHAANWTQQAYVKASNTDLNDHFAGAVAISGETAVVGAAIESSNSAGINGNQGSNSFQSSGAVYVFVRAGGFWSQQAYIKASNPAAADFFGCSVGISGDTLVVGAYLEDSAATGVNGDQTSNSSNNSGAAYVFTRSGNAWSQQAYLKSSNTDANDYFGYSVAISGDTVVVGAVNEASNATGVNGNASDNSAPGAGAAYLFFRTGNTWNPQAYLKASNTGATDSYAYSLSVSGDLIVVGAPFEGSNSTGVNGPQNNDLSPASGAVYVFDADNNPGTLSYGTGTPGCAGVQTLDVTHAPMIHSPHFAFTCSNAPPLSMGLGIVTDSQDVAGSDVFGVGVLIHSDLLLATEVMTFDFFSDNTGYSETTGTGIPNNPLLIGKTYYASALWAWPTSTCTIPGLNPFNLSTSKGLKITLLVP